ncbi:hypothetical protein [Microbacterium sp. ZW T5_56]|uniref:hypothetical protein n=1 Tax=Microbacterium sp. ZW T5_56 TaxID=3378081 RepID=UPI0038525D7C
MFDFPGSYEAARGRILLRPFGTMPAAVRYLELSVGDRAEAFPAVVSASSEIGVAPVVTVEAGTAWLTEATLAGWGIDAQQVLSDALSGASGLPIDVRPVGEGAFLVHGEAFSGAVWAAPQLVSGLGVHGHPVIWNAGRTLTLVTGDQSPRGFQAALGVLNEQLGSGVELETLTPHRAEGAAWTPIAWPSTTPAGSLHEAERLFARHWYERQRGPLRTFYEQQGVDMNVPEYRVMKSPEGRVVSACAYVAGISNAVPDVDTVLEVQADGSTRQLSWDDLRVHAQPPLQGLNTRPPRWLAQ